MNHGGITLRTSRKYRKALCWVGVGVVVFLLVCFNIRCAIFARQDDNACGMVLFPEEKPASVMTMISLPTTASQQHPSSVQKGNVTIFQRFLRELEEHNLPRSARHQLKFHSKRHLLDTRFPKSMLFSTNMENFGGVALNDTYGYMYVLIDSRL
jgi:hypothetical protein